MILATKSGWMIACQIKEETDKGTAVIITDNNQERFVKNKSKTEKLFDSAYDALDWIEEKQ
jgi:hypothetical protein